MGRNNVSLVIFVGVVDNYHLQHLLKSAGLLCLAEFLRKRLGKSFENRTLGKIECTNRLLKSSSMFSAL